MRQLMQSITGWTLALCLTLCHGAGVAQDLSSIIDQPALAGATVGIHAVSLSSGKVIVSHDADRLMIPASTQKILTGITALRHLGADYQIETRIAYSGDITTDGTVTGDLIITGNYDPTLGSDRLKGSPDLDQLLELLGDKISQKVSCIDGNIIIVSPPAADYHPHRYWLYEDLGNYYGSPAYPINIQENTYRISMSRHTQVGHDCHIKSIEPSDLGIEVNSAVTIGARGSGDQAYILGSPGDYDVTVVGTLPPGTTAYTIKGSMPDPPAYFARRLHETIDDQGVKSQGHEVVRSYDRQTTTLTTIESPRLADIIATIHKKSNNLYTEALYNHLSRPELKLSKGHKMVDACGLSPMNRISAQQLTTFLSKEKPTTTILRTLPVAGKSGTMRNLLTDAPYRGNIYAKSGSMSGVLCYAGYMQDGSDWIAFAVMINGFDQKTKPVKPIAEQVMQAIYDY